jgi:hypothetical protein
MKDTKNEAVASGKLFIRNSTKIVQLISVMLMFVFESWDG